MKLVSFNRRFKTYGGKEARTMSLVSVFSFARENTPQNLSLLCT